MSGTLSQALGAGQIWQLQTSGDYFRLVSAPASVNVDFYRAGAKISQAVGMDTGFYCKPAGGFDRVDITSPTAQTVKIMLLDGDGGYDRFNVDISGGVAIAQAATITDGAPVVVGVAATALVAASATRRAVRFTNAGTVDVFLGGAGVTVGNGALKIAAGQTWLENEGAPAAWYGISGAADQPVKIQELA